MVIYIARNRKNGKSYVGKTTYSFEIRKKAHIRECLKENPKTHFHKALRKWGLDTFEWEIVETAESEEELNVLEQFYIGKENSYANGYNQTLGGEGQKGWIPNDETRRLWSSQRKGKNQWKHLPRIVKEKPVISEEEMKARNEERKRKVSEKLKGRSPWNKGLSKWQALAHIDINKANEKTQQKRRDNGYVWTIEATIIETGEVMLFDSQTSAAKHFGFDHKTIRRKIDKNSHKGVFFRKIAYLYDMGCWRSDY